MLRFPHKAYAPVLVISYVNVIFDTFSGTVILAHL